MFSKIIGTGGYLPNKILTNKNLESLVDTTDEWIIENLKITKSRTNGSQLESFNESYEHKIKNGSSLFKKANKK